MSYKKILVGTDGSETAGFAVLKAGKIAQACKAELMIVTAYQNPPARAVEGWQMIPTWNENVPSDLSWQVSPSALAAEILERGKVIAERAGAQVTVESGEGHAAEVIIELAEQHGTDLIVVGNVGMTGGKRFLLGSIPDHVSHHSPCDLLIARTAQEEPSRTEIYSKILIATDGSPTANVAVAAGFEFARVMGASVILLYVGEKEMGDPILEETIEREAKGVKTQARVEQGYPADQIYDVAEREGVDLIVLGNRGMKGPRRFLIGGVPNQISHYSPTDVLIVKTV